MSNLQF